MAVDARQAGDDRAAEVAAHLEERTLVDHRLDDRAHLVDLRRLRGMALISEFVGAPGSSLAGSTGGSSCTDDGR
jgi:hypothetical protein